MLAVTTVLLVVGLVNRFIQYLGQAVAGEMASDVLLLLILYRLPDFLLVILPLAFFLGVLLVYGRMYAENEMTVLIASGLSKGSLLFHTFAVSLLVTVVVALLSLELAPWGIRNTEQLKQEQDQLTELDLIVAGQFQAFSDGTRVTYAESIGNSEQGRQLQNVFVVSSPSDSVDGGGRRVTVAEIARPEIDLESGSRFMRLENVMQYQGVPGDTDFTIGQFDVQAVLLPEVAEIEELDEEKALATSALFGTNEPALQAELQWRISAILIIPIVALLALPLSKVSPRQGRFGRLVPAALLYAVYYVLLQVARDQVADGVLGVMPGMWWVHGVFLALGWYLYSESGLTWRRRRQEA